GRHLCERGANFRVYRGRLSVRVEAQTRVPQSKPLDHVSILRGELHCGGNRELVAGNDAALPSESFDLRGSPLRYSGHAVFAGASLLADTGRIERGYLGPF